MGPSGSTGPYRGAIPTGDFKSTWVQAREAAELTAVLLSARAPWFTLSTWASLGSLAITWAGRTVCHRTQLKAWPL